MRAGGPRPPLAKRLLLGICFLAAPLAANFALSALTAPAPAAAGLGVPVKVLLGAAAAGRPASFAVDGAWRLYRGAGVRAFRDPAYAAWGYRLAPVQVAIRPDGRIAINNTTWDCSALCLVPEDDGTIRVGARSYPGVLLIEKHAESGVRLVNILDVEQYLAAVLFEEMPASFPREALKSQVVAARSYALHAMIRGQGFLQPDDRSQMYGGAGAITAKSEEIVRETAGEVLAWEGRLLPAYYSSTCGGMSSKADDVFPNPSPAPLNHNKPCGFCSSSPFFQWSASFPIGDVLAAFGYEGGERAVEIGVTASDTARRALEIALLDDRGRVLRRCGAADFRRKMNAGRPLQQRMLSARIDRILVERETVTIEGRGFGHGVGLCQYGARGMAERGDSYRRILGFYFPGSEVVHVSRLAAELGTEP